MGVTFAFVAVLLAQALPDGPGKDLVEAICTACHTTERIVQQHMTKEEWQNKILEMLQECPDVTQDERATIADYLAKSFPKRVNVNKASAKELETVLAIPAKDAAAIVAYRESKGGFKTIDDLKKVPGVDAARLEANKSKLDF